LDKSSSYPVLGSYLYTGVLGLSFRALPEKKIGRRGRREVEWWRSGVMEWWSGGVVERWSGGAVERWSGGAVEWWSGASVFRGNGAGSVAHYFVGTGTWGTG
jgi:hypothetical protein